MTQAVPWALLAAPLVMIGIGVAGWMRDRRRRVASGNDWAGGILSMAAIALIMVSYLMGEGSLWIPALIGGGALTTWSLARSVRQNKRGS